jgi:putative protease
VRHGRGALRAALDAYRANPEAFVCREEWNAALARLAEGTCSTLGAYHRPWQ